MEPLLKSAVWKMFIWLPDFILRRIFSPNKFATLVDIDIRPRHESVSINLGRLPQATICLTVTNNSPFEVELDRLLFELWVGGAVINFYKLNRTIVKSRTSEDIYIKGNFSEGEANSAACHEEDRHISAQVIADFNSKFTRFPFSKNLSGITPKFSNKQLREPD